MEAMQYVKSEKYNTPALQAKIMGPNPIKLEEDCWTIRSRPTPWCATWAAGRD